MIKSILVSINDSVSSISALNVSVKLAKLSSSKLKGLFVEDCMRLYNWQPPELTGNIIGTSSMVSTQCLTKEQTEIEKEITKERNKLEKLFNDIKDENKINGFFSSIRGKIDDSIYEASKTVDLVVMGRGNKKLREISGEVEPTVYNIIHKAARPIIITPPNTQLNSRILIAYDGSESSQRALAFAVSLIKLTNAEVSVISVADDDRTSSSMLFECREYLSPHGIEAKYKADNGIFAPWNAIFDYTNEFKPGLIIMGSYGKNKNNIIEMIFGSTLKSILSSAKCPVLICK